MGKANIPVRWVAYLISEADAEEEDIDRDFCLKHEREHYLDDIDRLWRLKGRRAVKFTIFLLKQTVNQHYNVENRK